MAISKITSIVSSSDMTGKYTLDVGNDTTKFDAFIVENEYQILIDMLGANLYNTYADDQEDEAWKSLLAGEQFTDIEDNIRNWQGLKNMLVPYHYSQWILLNEFHQSVTSMFEPDNKNSVKISSSKRKAESNNAYNIFIIEWYNVFDYMYAAYDVDNDVYTDFFDYFRHKQFKGLFVRKTI